MKAIEFEAEIQNGVIAIPEEYPEFNRGRVKVIVLQEEKAEVYRQALKSFDELTAFVQATPELRDMTEEEINDIVKEVRRGQK